MNVVYRVNFTEFESGWGQRPDGYIMAKTKEIAIKVIRDIESMGSYSCYTRANTQPYLFETTDEIYKDIQEDEDGYFWFFKEEV
jgi:hypothetical protein